MMAIAMVLLSILPQTGIARDRADVVEVNWFYDDTGRLVFTQMVWWLWNRDLARSECMAWRLLRHPSQRPQLDWRTGEYVSAWQDGDLFRVVRSTAFRETWTQVDVELIDRDVLPKERRQELSNPKGNP